MAFLYPLNVLPLPYWGSPKLKNFAFVILNSWHLLITKSNHSFDVTTEMASVN